MAHNKKFGEFMAATVAAYPQTITSTRLEASSINATGYDRATFIFGVGAPSSVDAYISSGALIWNAATSGATYTAVAGASFGTHLTGGNSQANFVIDVNVNPSYPWLRVSASNCSSTGTYSVMCVLRTPQNMPPTSLSGQIVTV
jgi:hypothetical protein